MWIRTSSLAVEFLGVFDGSPRLLLSLLSLATLVKVLDDDSDEHVQHEEADQQQERDEVEQAPLAVVPLRLSTSATLKCKSRVINNGGRSV